MVSDLILEDDCKILQKLFGRDTIALRFGCNGNVRVTLGLALALKAISKVYANTYLSFEFMRAAKRLLLACFSNLSFRVNGMTLRNCDSVGLEVLQHVVFSLEGLWTSGVGAGNELMFLRRFVGSNMASEVGSQSEGLVSAVEYRALVTSVMLAVYVGTSAVSKK